MTRDDIIRMAREAGAVTGVKSLLNCDGDSIVFVPEELERFVELFAQTVRLNKAVWHFQKGREAGAAEEREACAQVCEEIAEFNRQALHDSMWQQLECASAIRRRGNHDAT